KPAPAKCPQNRGFSRVWPQSVGTEFLPRGLSYVYPSAAGGDPGTRKRPADAQDQGCPHCRRTATSAGAEKCRVLKRGVAGRKKLGTAIPRTMRYLPALWRHRFGTMRGCILEQQKF